MRFEVKIDDAGKAYYIYDNEKYHTGKAIVLYFANLERITTICRLLNEEWAEFLRNPS